MKELAPHQQRVVDEKIELDKKHYTLRQFMVFSPIFPVLDPGEQRRLKDQHEVMAQYSKILGKRIDAFQPQSDSSSEPGGKDDEKENDIDMESDDFGNEYRDKKMKNKLYILVGLPRSGKSTWARTQMKPIVSPDAIRLALHGQQFIASAEPIVWATAKLMVNSLFIAGCNEVILDATNTTKKRRDEWISDEWERVFVCFDTPLDVCIQRCTDSIENNKVVPRGEWIDYSNLVPIVQRMNDQLESVDELNETNVGIKYITYVNKNQLESVDELNETNVDITYVNKNWLNANARNPGQTLGCNSCIKG